MKAVHLIRYGSPEDLRIADLPRPDPGPDQVLVRVGAASVNDWDWGLCRGKPFYIRLLCGLRRPRIQIPGVDVAGTVEAVGAQVSKWRPGDRVFGDLSECGFGAFAEHVCAPEDVLAAVPAGLTLAQAAALPHAGALAAQGLRLARVGGGDRVLMNGAGGGVGSIVGVLAKHFGASHVTGVDHGTKLEFMRDAGYDEALDYTQVDFTRTGEQYDVVLDAKTTRSPGAYARALRPGGRYVTVGGVTPKLLRLLVTGALIGRLGRCRLRILALKPNRDLDVVTDLASQGRLNVALDRVVPLAEAPAALRAFGHGEHRGKIVLVVRRDVD